MKAFDVMTRSPRCATPDTSLQLIARMMTECDCGAIPIVSDLQGRLPLGIVTDRDIVVRTIAAGLNALALTARDCMTTPVAAVPEDAAVSDCLALVEQRQIRRLLVTDKLGGVVGIIAQADLAASMPKRKTGELVQEVSKPIDGPTVMPRY
jgi:CBS domain-containing protein